MAVQSSFYNTDGITRTFPSTKHIATKQHCAVYLKLVSDSSWEVVSVSDYELVNNSVVFITAPSTLVNSMVEVRVADEQDELSSSPSDIAIVAGIASDITTVSTNKTSVQTVATNINSVNTTSGSIAKVTTVANSIANVNNVGNSIANVNTVSTSIDNVNTAASNIANVNTVAGISGNVTTVASISTKVTTVANNNTNVTTVANNISNVNTVGGISSNVTTVAGISANVTSVAGNATNINSVATNIVPNLAEILLADTNASIATTKAAEASASAASALASELAATAIVTDPLKMAIGNINSPLLDMPLKNSLAMKAGVGSATFTRASTATYIDRYGVLKTAAIDEPRFEKEGYLNEGSSTNLLPYSEQFDNAAWGKSSLTVTANTTETLDPYGTNLAEKISKTAAYGRIQQSPTVSAIPHTFSVFVKAGTADNCTIRMMTGVAAEVYTIRFTFSTKTASYIAGTGTNKIEELANGWFRVSLTATFIDTTSLCIIHPDIYNTESTGSIYIFGAQLEALPFASSYIPTVASTVTRSLDSGYFTTYGNMIDLTEGTIIFDLESPDVATSRYFFGNYKDAANYITVRFSATAVQFRITYNSVLYTIGVVGLENNTKHRVALTVSGNVLSTYLDGTLSSTTTTLPAGFRLPLDSATYFGKYSSSSGTSYVNFTNFRIYDKALTAQEVALA